MSLQRILSHLQSLFSPKHAPSPPFLRLSVTMIDPTTADFSSTFISTKQRTAQYDHEFVPAIPTKVMGMVETANTLERKRTNDAVARRRPTGPRMRVGSTTDSPEED